MEWETVWSIASSPLVLGPLGLVVLGVGDAIIKKTKNKTDDMIWKKWVRKPLARLFQRKLGSKVGMVLLLLWPLATGCAATVTKTDEVTSVTWVWGAAEVRAGPECEEGEGCRGVTISGGHASEGFLRAVVGPVGTVLRGLLGGL